MANGGAASEGFQSWSASSVVTDDTGSPLVLYRAGSIESSLRGFFFTDAEWRAQRYGDTCLYHVKMANPFVTDFNGNLWCDGDGDFNSIDDIAEYAAREGYDGVIAYNVRGKEEDKQVTTEVVVFSRGSIWEILPPDVVPSQSNDREL